MPLIPTCLLSSPGPLEAYRAGQGFPPTWQPGQRVLGRLLLPPGQTPFSVEPQSDLSCLTKVPLPCLCSHTAHGQAHRVSPVTSLSLSEGCSSAALGPAEHLSLERRTLSVPSQGQPPALPFFSSPPGPWSLAEGQTGNIASILPIRPGAWARLRLKAQVLGHCAWSPLQGRANQDPIPAH